MSIQVFDPKALAEHLASPEMPAVKLYELLIKACADSITQMVFAWQNPIDGKLFICSDDVNDYVESLLSTLEEETGEMWTDDTTFFDITGSLDSMSELITGPMETYTLHLE